MRKVPLDVRHALRMLGTGFRRPAARVGREELRRIRAQLQDILLPWVHAERVAREAGGAATHAAASEPAVLEARIGELVRALGAALELSAAADAEQWRSTVADLRDRAHGIRAQLGLQAQQVDAATGSAALLASVSTSPARLRLSPAGPSWRGGRLKTLGRPQIDALLRLGFWGVLSTVGPDGKPFATPVAYGWDGASLYAAVGEGRKARNLRRHPWVMFNVIQVTEGLGWWSIGVSGRVDFLSDYAARVYAREILHRQRERTSSTSQEDTSRLDQLVRLVPSSITGRMRG